MERRGSTLDEALELVHRLVGAQLVEVVDYQPSSLLKRGHILDQPLDDRPAVEIRRRRQLANQRPDCRRPTQSVEHRQPEPLRVAFILVQENPGGTTLQAGVIDPRSQQDRLPAARGRRQLRDTGRSGQPAIEIQARDDQVVSPTMRTVEPCHVPLQDSEPRPVGCGVDRPQGRGGGEGGLERVVRRLFTCGEGDDGCGIHAATIAPGAPAG